MGNWKGKFFNGYSPWLTKMWFKEPENRVTTIGIVLPDVAERMMKDLERQIKRSDILEMKPGRELDALVAKAIGYVSMTTQLNHDGTYGTLPYFSTDMNAAWDVVEKLQLENVMNFRIQRMYCVSEMKWRSWFEDLDYTQWSADGWTAPEAICKAALLTLMEDDKNVS